MSENVPPHLCGFMWFGFLRNALKKQYLVTEVVTDLLVVNSLSQGWLLDNSLSCAWCKVKSFIALTKLRLNFAGRVSVCNVLKYVN
jgi:hypothetical protein